MKDWDKVFNSLPPAELDKIALLRMIECTNGCIQYAYRDNDYDTLTVDEIRDAMKFSMGCMKTMSIPIDGEEIRFSPEVEEIMREMRDIYIRGFKKGDDDALDEFFVASKANLRAVGLQRIKEAKQIVYESIDAFPPHTLVWGINYIMRFAELVE